jgi:hypothetical protein
MTAETAGPAGDGTSAPVRCWCCGQQRSEGGVVRLGSRPEVAVCLRCAHYLHRQARHREDAARRFSPLARARDGLRAGRRLVLRRGWHRAPVIGAVLRRLGPRLP